jgi:hypothetical protein
MAPPTVDPYLSDGSAAAALLAITIGASTTVAELPTNEGEEEDESSSTSDFKTPSSESSESVAEEDPVPTTLAPKSFRQRNKAAVPVEVKVEPSNETGKIISVQGPLPKIHVDYKKCSYNFLVEWTPSGRITRVPINAYDQEQAAAYAKEHGLLNTEGFKRFKRFYKGEEVSKRAETSSNDDDISVIQLDDEEEENGPKKSSALAKIVAQESRRKLNTVALATEKCFKELRSPQPNWPQLDICGLVLNEIKGNKSGRQAHGDKKRVLTQINILCRDPEAAKRLMSALNWRIDESKYVMNISYNSKDHMARLLDDDTSNPAKKKKQETRFGDDDAKLPAKEKPTGTRTTLGVTFREERNEERSYDPKLAAANPETTVTYAQMEDFVNSFLNKKGNELPPAMSSTSEPKNVEKLKRRESGYNSDRSIHSTSSRQRSRKGRVDHRRRSDRVATKSSGDSTDESTVVSDVYKRRSKRDRGSLTDHIEDRTILSDQEETSDDAQKRTEKKDRKRKKSRSKKHKKKRRHDYYR